MFVWSVGSTKPCIVVGGIADARQRAITQQMRNITHVTDVYLFVSLCYVGIEFCGIFQLKDAERYAINEEQHVRDAHIVFHTVGNLELINRSEDIIFFTVGTLKIDKTNIKVHSITMAGISIAVTDKLKCVAQTFKVGLSGNVAQIVDHLIDIAAGEVGITMLQVHVQIIDIWIFDKQRFTQLAVDVSAIGILPALVLQQVNQGFFIFTFVEFSSHDIGVLGVSSPLH